MAAFASSYIKTEASQVTRAADAASMTGANFSSWYNQAEGTLYGEWSAPNTETTTRIAAGVSDGATSNWILLSKTVANRTGSEAYVSGVAQCSLTSAAANIPGKAAFAYKVNDFAASTNGLLDGTDAVGTIPLVSQLNIGDRPTGARQLNGTIRKLAYYPVRIQNAQLQGLTS
jgi:hypothetical protein